MEKLRKSLVTAGGITYLLFGIFHNSFWFFFSKVQNVDPSFIKITRMLNLGVMLFFLAMGIIFLRYQKEILGSPIGNALLILSSVFFIIRLAAEFFLPPCAIGLVITLTVISLIYLLPALMRKDQAGAIAAQSHQLDNHENI